MPVNRVPQVMSQVAKLLNVEGYPVVATDPATQAVTLDAGLLAEQYGVRAQCRAGRLGDTAPADGGFTPRQIGKTLA